LVVIRSLMGVVSAPLHPSAAKAVSLGIPFAGRSAANGFVTGAALLGVAATYPLFSHLIDWLGWPAAFVVAALATLVVGWLWSRGASVESAHGAGNPGHRDAAHESRGSGSAGLEPSSGPSPAEPVANAGSLVPVLDLRAPSPVRSFVRRNKNLLLLTSSYAAVSYFQYLFFYWMHYYFETILELGKDRSQYYAAIPPLAMAIGMPLGGWISDRAAPLVGPWAARAGLVISAMTASAGFLLVGILSTEPIWIVTWLSLSLGILGLAEGPFWVTAVEVGGRRGGLSAAVLNTGGNAGGILAPVVTPWLSDTLHLGWQVGMAAGSAVCLLGAVAWCWIDLTSTGGRENEAIEPPAKPVYVPQANS
jgi:MFS family permease